MVLTPLWLSLARRDGAWALMRLGVVCVLPSFEHKDEKHYVLQALIIVAIMQPF